MTFSPRFFVIGLSIAAVIGALLSKLLRINCWIAFGIGVIALLANGYLAEVEDREAAKKR